jgi:hypothetical protein
MSDALKPSPTGRKCCMSDALKKSILDRMDPSCLMAERPSGYREEVFYV